MAKKKTNTTDGSDGVEVEAAKPYVVLARKYRPATFDDLIGQSAMVTTLRNAFASGRIAQGYMLTGVRGVGKTTTARILARALNYEAPGFDKPTIDMPGLGVHCKDIMEGRHPDVLEIDAASNTGVDNIREIIESAQYTPMVARTKVFIIDEVHMLSKGAFNALLKTLEEPPAHVRFIFATTEIRKVPVTVLSRCQRFDLRRVEQPVLAEHFQKIATSEGARADADALQLIARAAEGSVRDGLSILDQAIAMGEGHVTAASVRDMLGLADRARIFDLAEALFRGDLPAALEGFTSLHRDGAEAAAVVSDLAEAVHAIARVKAVGEDPASEGLTAEEKRRCSDLAARLSMPYLSRAWQMLLKGLEEVTRAPNPQVVAEMVLIRLAYTADLPTPDELIRSLGGATIPARRAAPAPAESNATARGPLNVSAPAPTSQTTDAVTDDSFDFDDEADQAGDDTDELGDEAMPPVPVQSAKSDPRSFADVVALVGDKRDAKLKIHLEDHVSLVKFDAVAGSIDIFLLPGAPPELANDLREKLNAWTGRRWMVVLSKEAGSPAIGTVRRAQEAADLEQLKAHPAVRAVLQAFPDAKIAEVRRIAGGETDRNDDKESEAG
jgi:DNA polymerase-3 subunit gamma/tau